MAQAPPCGRDDLSPRGLDAAVGSACARRLAARTSASRLRWCAASLSFRRRNRTKRSGQEEQRSHTAGVLGRYEKYVSIRNTSTTGSPAHNARVAIWPCQTGRAP